MLPNLRIYGVTALAINLSPDNYICSVCNLLHIIHSTVFLPPETECEIMDPLCWYEFRRIKTFIYTEKSLLSFSIYLLFCTFKMMKQSFHVVGHNGSWSVSSISVNYKMREGRLTLWRLHRWWGYMGCIYFCGETLDKLLFWNTVHQYILIWSLVSSYVEYQNTIKKHVTINQVFHGTEILSPSLMVKNRKLNPTIHIIWLFWLKKRN